MALIGSSNETLREKQKTPSKTEAQKTGPIKLSKISDLMTGEREMGRCAPPMDHEQSLCSGK